MVNGLAFSQVIFCSASLNCLANAHNSTKDGSGVQSRLAWSFLAQGCNFYAYKFRDILHGNRILICIFTEQY